MVYSKTCLKRSPPKNVFKTNYRLVSQNAPREYSEILSSFIKLPPVFETFVLYIFEWLFKTGFTVLQSQTNRRNGEEEAPGVQDTDEDTGINLFVSLAIRVQAGFLQSNKTCIRNIKLR